MPNWISLHDLLNRWDIEKFEVIEYLKKGLRPYAKVSGRPLDCPLFCHLGPINEGIIKTSLETEEAYGPELNEYHKLLVAYKEMAEKELKVIKKDDPGFVSWKWLVELGEDTDDDFKRIFSHLDEAIFKRDDVLEFEKKRKLKPKKENSKAYYQKVFPCKPGTKWEDVKITLIENEAAKIETPQGSGRFVYHELGMSDKRSGNKPTMLWAIFKFFAQNNGVLSSKNFSYNPKLPDIAKRLNKHLQEVFGIDGSIYSAHYKSRKEYRTKIVFSDQTIVD
jgi:hypothetical protein